MNFDTIMKGKKDLLKKEKQEELLLKKEKKKNKITPFTYTNQILSKSRKVPYDKSKGSAFLMSMHFSHDPEFIDIVNKINCLQFHLKDDIIYEYYMAALPQTRRWIKWAKKTPESKKFEKAVKVLMEDEGLSKREAKLTVKYKERLTK